MPALCPFLFLIAALVCAAAEPAPQNPGLRTHLLSLVEEIERDAEQTVALPPDRKAEIDAARHARHREKLRTFLETRDWLDRAMVGGDGTEAALILLQEECRDIVLMQLAIRHLHAATQQNRAPLSDLARLIDAARVGAKRMQVYGTQYRAAVDGTPVRFPLEDLENVDCRRRLAGLSTLRDQDEAMGIVEPRPGVDMRRFQPPWTKPHWRTRLQTARGLNEVSFPRLRMIYVHSRDDPRAKEGERNALPGLDTKTLPLNPNAR